MPLKPRPGNIPDNRTDHSVFHFALHFQILSIPLLAAHGEIMLSPFPISLYLQTFTNSSV
jgi:hypothetical protein